MTEVLPYRRVLLVGFMGSGKSRVGETLAKRLGWGFIDGDAEVEREAGLSVEEIFRDRGEPFFRRVEDRVTRRALRRDRVVLAAGGGWPARAGAMESVGRDTLTVWLRVAPEEALRRISPGGETVRPLLRGPDAAGRASGLLSQRDPYYRKAAIHLTTDGASPAGLAGAISDHLKGAR